MALKIIIPNQITLSQLPAYRAVFSVTGVELKQVLEVI